MNATLLNCLKSHELADPLAEDEAGQLASALSDSSSLAGLPALNFVRAERRLLSGPQGVEQVARDCSFRFEPAGRISTRLSWIIAKDQY